ncbi:MAG TPA: glycosyltransferase family 4 protein [Sphingomonadaceae bacterium]|nr:glycosyltransferase family 4 protein [Sphingomonadaceae bacterium]
MKVLAFTKYGSLAASTRQRVLQYVPYLEQAGMTVESHALLDNDYVQSLATGKPYSKTRVIRSYVNRLQHLMRHGDADVLWVYAELFPYLPAWFERLAFRQGKPVVYDFDDAFFHQYDANPNPAVRRALAGKLEPLLRGAAACCCGNAYLRDYASRFCERTLIVPTAVDSDRYRPSPRAADRQVTIGWIGSPSTFGYLDFLIPLLRELVSTHDVRIHVVGAGAAGAGTSFPGLKLIDWTEASEVESIQKMDIGIMPLPDELWARGKSGYKLIQYMACGLPVVASPVGVNGSMVEHGFNGYLARTPEEWRVALLLLLEDKDRRRRMGVNGRERFVERYSLRSQAPRIVELFSAVGR